MRWAEVLNTDFDSSTVEEDESHQILATLAEHDDWIIILRQHPKRRPTIITNHFLDTVENNIAQIEAYLGQKLRLVIFRDKAFVKLGDVESIKCSNPKTSSLIRKL